MSVTAQPDPSWNEEFRQFLESREPLVRSRLARYAEGPDHLDDLLQETWTRCLERWEQYRGRGRTAWVLAVARSIAIDDHRARRRRLRLARQHQWDREGTLKPSAMELDEIRQEVGKAFHALTEREREVVHLRFLSDQSTPDVASLLRISESTVRVHLANALKKLRTALGGR